MGVQWMDAAVVVERVERRAEGNRCPRCGEPFPDERLIQGHVDAVHSGRRRSELSAVRGATPIDRLPGRIRLKAWTRRAATR